MISYIYRMISVGIRTELNAANIFEKAIVYHSSLNMLPVMALFELFDWKA